MSRTLLLAPLLLAAACASEGDGDDGAPCIDSLDCAGTARCDLETARCEADACDPGGGPVALPPRCLDDGGDPGEPWGGSFQEDFVMVRNLVRERWPDLDLGSTWPEASLYADLDGDGRAEIVQQVFGGADAGVVILRDGPTVEAYRLGAGEPSPLGRDLFWVETWCRVARRDVPGLPEAAGDSIRLAGFDDRDVRYLSLVDGAPAVSAGPCVAP